MNNHKVIFRHPAYPDTFEQNILFQLYAWDGHRALHAGTALLACRVIACNAWDGYLTDKQDGSKLNLGEDELIPAGEYYFNVPRPPTEPPPENGGHYKYPIYPSFQHWAFPHGRVPRQWGGENNVGRITVVMAEALDRDNSCIISKYRDNIQRVYLCPRDDLDWFRVNGMTRYTTRRDASGDAGPTDMANVLLMRTDIHRAFNRGNFILVPKSREWTIHFLERTHDLGRKFHNRPVEVRGVSSEFLLTRFAWAIFPLVEQFMEQGPRRAVRVREESEGAFHEVSKTLNMAELDRSEYYEQHGDDRMIGIEDDDEDIEDDDEDIEDDDEDIEDDDEDIEDDDGDM